MRGTTSFKCLLYQGVHCRQSTKRGAGSTSPCVVMEVGACAGHILAPLSRVTDSSKMSRPAMQCTFRSDQAVCGMHYSLQCWAGSDRRRFLYVGISQRFVQNSWTQDCSRPAIQSRSSGRVYDCSLEAKAHANKYEFLGFGVRGKSTCQSV